MYELYKRTESLLWQAKLHLNDGTFTRVSCKTSDEQQARLFAEERLRELNYKLKFGLSTRSVTVGEMYGEWFKELTPSKQQHIKGVWSKLEPTFGHRKLDTLTVDDIETFRDGMTVGRCLKGRVNEIFNRVYDKALRKKLITVGQRPILSSVPNDFNVRDAFSQEEIDTILDYLKAKAKEGSRSWQSTDQNWVMLYYVSALVATGARPGTELLQTRWCDWAYAKGNQRFLTVKIKKENSKVKKDRVAVADNFLGDLLFFDWQNYQIRHGYYDALGYVFANRAGTITSTGYDFFKRILTELNILYNNDGEERVLYSIRHYYATKKLLGGVSTHILGKQMGTSAKMIETHYSKVLATQAAEVLVE